MSSSADLLPGRLATRHTLPACLFAGFGVALLLPAGFRPLEAAEQLVFSALAMTLLSLAALSVVTALPEGAHGVARWRLGPWYLIWGALAFGVAPLTWLLPQPGSANRIALPSVVAALSLFGVSLVPWLAGYCAGAPRAVGSLAARGLSLLLRGTTPTLRGGSMPWVLYGTGTAARLVTVAVSGRFGYVGDPRGLVSHAGRFDHLLRMVSLFALFAIAAAAYRAFSDPTRGNRLTLWSLVGIEIVVGALAGGKQNFILAALAILIPYGAIRGRFPVRLLLTGALTFLLVVAPFNSAYRSVVRGEQSALTPSAAVAAAPATLSGVLDSGSSGTLSDSTLTLLRRLRMSDSVAVIAQLTPETIPYRSPAEFASAPLVGLVPRALWPQKPVLTTGYEFSQEYYALPSHRYSSAGVTPLGDLYRHGGLVTVVIGMLLLGMGARLFDSLLRPEVDPRAICFVLVFVPMLVRADIYTMLVGLPSGIVVATVGARLICGRSVATKSPR